MFNIKLTSRVVYKDILFQMKEKITKKKFFINMLKEWRMISTRSLLYKFSKRVS